MQSFRTEIENPIVEKDIIELEQKIREFKAKKKKQPASKRNRLLHYIFSL